MSLIGSVQNFRNVPANKKVANVLKTAAVIGGTAAIAVAAIRKGSAIQGAETKTLKKLSSGIGHYVGFGTGIVANTVKAGAKKVVNFVNNIDKFVARAKKGLSEVSAKAVEKTTSTVNTIKNKFSK